MQHRCSVMKWLKVLSRLPTAMVWYRKAADAGNVFGDESRRRSIRDYWRR